MNKHTTLYDLLLKLEPGTLLENHVGYLVSRECVLDERGSDLTEHAVQIGNELYFTTVEGDVYTAAEPVFTIVREGRIL